MHMNYILYCVKCRYRQVLQHEIDIDNPNKFVPPKCGCGSTDYEVEEKRLIEDKLYGKDDREVSCNNCDTLYMYGKGSLAICPICAALLFMAVDEVRTQ